MTRAMYFGVGARIRFVANSWRAFAIHASEKPHVANEPVAEIPLELPDAFRQVTTPELIAFFSCPAVKPSTLAVSGTPNSLLGCGTLSSSFVRYASVVSRTTTELWQQLV